jgi:hypothetical protein
MEIPFEAFYLVLPKRANGLRGNAGIPLAECADLQWRDVHFRYWHISDVPTALTNIGYRG